MRNRHSPGPVLRSLAACCAAAAMFMLVGCENSPTGPTTDVPLVAQATVVSPTVPTPVAEKIFVCKDGPVGTYDFTARVTSGAISAIVNGVPKSVLIHDTDIDGQSSFSVDAGACVQIALAGGESRTVEVTELAHAGTEFVSSSTAQLTSGSVATTTTGNPTSGKLSGSPLFEGAVLVFTNRELTPNLDITKVADAATVPAGSAIGFTITVTNNGPGTATGVTLSDPLPTGAGISWSISPAVAGCSITAGVLNCSFGDLAAGASASVHVTSPTTLESCAVYNNTATADATNDDPVSASASTMVECPEWGGDETATGIGTTFPGSNNWFMYSPYTAGPIDLIAGQVHDAGDVTMSRSGGNTTITITLHAGWRWSPTSANLKIQPYDSAPTAYLQPGKFAYKFTVTGVTVSVTIPGTSANYYAIHGVVQQLLP